MSTVNRFNKIEEREYLLIAKLGTVHFFYRGLVGFGRGGHGKKRLLRGDCRKKKLRKKKKKKGGGGVQAKF